MFTGLIQDTGVVCGIAKAGGWRIGIETEMNLSETKIGSSIACSGCCLTVIDLQKNKFYVDVSVETLSKTSIRSWQAGTRVNLEPSLRIGDELGGHFVFGHIDEIVEIMKIEEEGNSHNFYIKQKEKGAAGKSQAGRAGSAIESGLAEEAGSIPMPADFWALIVPKGSVALDGVALTVNDVTEDYFTVSIIPHTWAHTTFQWRRRGDLLNFEADMLARYVAGMLDRQERRAA